MSPPSSETQVGYPESSDVGVLIGPFVRKQSYLNLLYLLISFPLGVFYFVFVVTALSVSFGLLIIVIGFFMLALTLGAVRGLAAWERQLGIWLLHATIPISVRRKVLWTHPLEALKVLVTDSWTWKGMAFLLLKFPLGVFSFVVCITLVSTSLALILCPLTYRFAPVTICSWRIATTEEALVCLIVGLILGLITIHLVNGLAAVWRFLATALLKGDSGIATTPLQNGPIVIP